MTNLPVSCLFISQVGKSEHAFVKPKFTKCVFMLQPDDH